MMEAFSKASEYCAVGLCVNASNLVSVSHSASCYPRRCSVPGKLDLDVVLVDRKPQVQKLQLAVVSVQQIPPRSTILPRAPHILPQPVQRRALLGIALRVVAIRGANVALERLYPVDLVRLLQRDRDHGYEGRHGADFLAKHPPASSAQRGGARQSGAQSNEEVAVGWITGAASNCYGWPCRMACDVSVPWRSRGAVGRRCKCRGG